MHQNQIYQKNPRFHRAVVLGSEAPHFGFTRRFLGGCGFSSRCALPITTPAGLPIPPALRMFVTLVVVAVEPTRLVCTGAPGALFVSREEPGNTFDGCGGEATLGGNVRGT